MAKTTDEVRALIERIAEEQSGFDQNLRGTAAWWDDLSPQLRSECADMHWTQYDVAEGRDRLEDLAGILGQL